MVVLLQFCVCSSRLKPPFVDAGPDMDLTCTTTEVMLDGSNSDSGPDYTYQWTTTMEILHLELLL